MLRSIAVLGILIAAVAGFTAFLRDEPPDPAAADVDYRTIVAEARDALRYDLFAPDELPEGWQANNARVEPGEPPGWHLGVLTADDDYIGLEQQQASVGDMVAQHSDGSRPAGAAQIGGREWQVRDDPDGDTTYVSSAGGVTVLVTGDAPAEQIESYIGSLRAG